MEEIKRLLDELPIRDEKNFYYEHIYCELKKLIDGESKQIINLREGLECIKLYDTEHMKSINLLSKKIKEIENLNVKSELIKVIEKSKFWHTYHRVYKDNNVDF